MKELSNLLSVEISNDMQDWDIECADASRLDEFCNIYENNSLSLIQKTELMKLIIASYDDSLNDKKFVFGWGKIARLIQDDYFIHQKTIEYWSLLDEQDVENVFNVTPLIRKIWKNFNDK